MEKSTISALVIAGGTVVAAVVQVLVLRAAKRKRALEETDREERERLFDSAHESGGTDSDR